MYFNEKDNATNIDKEFKDEKPSLFGNIDLKKIIIGGIIAVILIVFLFIIFGKKTEYFLDLKGNTDLVLYIGSDYVESGFEAYDSKGKKYDESEVTKTGTVNTDIAGEYILSYEFHDIKETRTVTVVSMTNKKTILGLYGNTIMFVPINTEFKDPGYYAMDSDLSNDEIMSMVKVEGEVNTSAVGNYKIKYTLINDMDITIVKERIVVVTSAEFALEHDPKEMTNKEVKIYGFISNNYFDYIELPDGKTEKERSFSYVVNENKSYTFKMFLKDGTSHEETIEINNIDNVKPTGYCTAVVDGNTEVKVYAEDSNEISGYVYNFDSRKTELLSESSYVYENTSEKVSVDVSDKAGNVANIVCSVKTVVRPSEPSSYPSSSSSTYYYSSKPSSSSSSKTSSYSPPSYPSTGNYIACKGDRTKYNNDLLNIVKNYGARKRITAVKIAKYISQDIGVRIPYFWAGGHWHFEWDGHTDREKFRGVSPQWGCITANYREFNGTNMLPAGFDCTGFIAWVLFNSGFEYGEIGSFSGDPVRTSLGGKKLTVINFAGSTGNVKAGDLVWRSGHQGFIIDVSGSTATIAHAKGTAYGLVVEKFNLNTGKNVNGGTGFDKISKMDNYYEG